MIAFLHGTLVEKELDHVVVDVGGVGYEVLVPLKNPDGALMPGMVCNAWLPSSDTTQLIVVPNRVVKIDHTGEHYVWLASGGKDRGGSCGQSSLFKK